MPRIRYIKPDFFKDEDLAFLDPKIRLFFAGLWCWADKSGRMEYRPKFLKAEIFPYEDFDSVKALDILENPDIPERKDKKFIIIYVSNGVKYIQINGFSKHQTPHKTEKESLIPPPNVSITVKQPLSNGEETKISVSNGDGDGDFNGDGELGVGTHNGYTTHTSEGLKLNGSFDFKECTRQLVKSQTYFKSVTSRWTWVTESILTQEMGQFVRHIDGKDKPSYPKSEKQAIAQFEKFLIKSYSNPNAAH